jgi:hypothetical protein
MHFPRKIDILENGLMENGLKSLIKLGNLSLTSLFSIANDTN